MTYYKLTILWPLKADVLIIRPGCRYGRKHRAVGVMRYDSMTLHSEKEGGSLSMWMHMPRHPRLDVGQPVLMGGRGPGESTRSERWPRDRMSERAKGSELVGFRVVNCGKHRGTQLKGMHCMRALLWR
jgi:hypothetical protein